MKVQFRISKLLLERTAPPVLLELQLRNVILCSKTEAEATGTTNVGPVLFGNAISEQSNVVEPSGSPITRVLMGNEKMTLDSLNVAPARAMKVAKRELMAKATVWHGEEAPPHVALLMPVLGFTRTDVLSDNAITPDGSEVESVGSALVATVMEPP